METIIDLGKVLPFLLIAYFSWRISNRIGRRIRESSAQMNREAKDLPPGLAKDQPIGAANLFGVLVILALAFAFMALRHASHTQQRVATTTNCIDGLEASVAGVAGRDCEAARAASVGTKLQEGK